MCILKSEDERLLRERFVEKFCRYLLICMRLFYFVPINYLKAILPRDNDKLIIENAQDLFVGMWLSVVTLYIKLQNVCEK